MLIKNKIKNPQQLLQAIQQFAIQSRIQNQNSFLLSTVHNIETGLKHPNIHDTWTMDDGSYCLCRYELDNEGSRVYTAYQLYVNDSNNGWSKIRKLLAFLKFYAQKHQCSKFNIITSRLDNIKAYSRGIGKQFKPTYLVFTQEI